MEIAHLNEQKVLEKAKEQFKDKYIHIMEDAFYSDAIEDGMYYTPLFHEPIVISTGYFYEFLNVRGNKTLSKLPLTLISVQNSPYDTVYNCDNYYYAYMENDEIKFARVEAFRTMIPYDKFEKI